jgi:hypothetical protein
MIPSGLIYEFVPLFAFVSPEPPVMFKKKAIKFEFRRRSCLHRRILPLPITLQQEPSSSSSSHVVRSQHPSFPLLSEAWRCSTRRYSMKQQELIV